MAKLTINNFNGGEVSPYLYAREDVDGIYNKSCLKMENFIPLPYGGASRRPATKYLGNSHSGKVRLIPFTFSVSENYLLEFGNLYVRVWKNDSPHKSSGEEIILTSPYLEAELDDIQYTQSADIVFLAHKNHQPQEIKRFSDTNWSMSEVNWSSPPLLEENTDQTIKITTSSKSGETILRASQDLFNANMVNGYFSFEADRLSGNISLEHEFSASGITESINVSNSNWDFETGGTWTGRVTIDRSLDGGVSFSNYITVCDTSQIDTAAEAKNFSVSSPTVEGNNTFLRVQYEKGADAIGNCQVSLIPTSSTVNSLVRITTFTDAKTVIATVISDFQDSISDYANSWAADTAFSVGDKVQITGGLAYASTSVDISAITGICTNVDTVSGADSNRVAGTYDFTSKVTTGATNAGSGTHARVRVVVDSSGACTVSVIGGGSGKGYAENDTFTITGSTLGGGADLTFDVSAIATTGSLDNTRGGAYGGDKYYAIDNQRNVYSFTRTGDIFYPYDKWAASDIDSNNNESLDVAYYSDHIYVIGGKTQTTKTFHNAPCAITGFETLEVWKYDLDGSNGSRIINESPGGNLGGGNYWTDTKFIIPRGIGVLNDRIYVSCVITNQSYYSRGSSRKLYHTNKVTIRRYSNTGSYEGETKLHERGANESGSSNLTYVNPRGLYNTPFINDLTGIYDDAVNQLYCVDSVSDAIVSVGTITNQTHSDRAQYSGTHFFNDVTDGTVPKIDSDRENREMSSTGDGSGARIQVDVAAGTGTATISIVGGGSGYAVNDTFTIDGHGFGNQDTNNTGLTFKVASIGVNNKITFLSDVALENAGDLGINSEFASTKATASFYDRSDANAPLLWVADQPGNMKKYTFEPTSRFYQCLEAVGATDGDSFSSQLTDGHWFQVNPEIQRWSEGAFSEYRGFPDTLTFFEGRLIFAGTPNSPNTLWLSEIDNFFNFKTSTLDTSPMRLTINSGQLDGIQWLVPHEALIIGTSGSEWALGSESDNKPVTPTSFDLKRKTTYGSNSIAGLLVNSAVLFVMRQGKKLREWIFNFDSQDYVAPDLTLVAEHVSADGFKAIALQQQPDNIVWTINGNDELVGMTYERDQKVVGWHRHKCTGIFESVTVLPNASGADSVYVSIKLTVNSAVVRYICKLDDREWGTNYVTQYNGLDYYRVVNSLSTGTISDYDYAVGETYTIVADGTTTFTGVVDSDGDLNIGTATDLTISAAEIASDNANHLKLTFSAAHGLAEGDTINVSGLGHSTTNPNGKYLLESGSITSTTVITTALTGGTETFSTSGSSKATVYKLGDSTYNRVVIGKPYTGTLAPLYLNYKSRYGSTVGSKLNATQATVRFKDTVTAKMGQTEASADLQPVKFAGTGMVSETALAYMSNAPEYLQTLYVVSDEPQPCTVLSMTPHVDTGSIR